MCCCLTFHYVAWGLIAHKSAIGNSLFWQKHKAIFQDYV